MNDRPRGTINLRLDKRNVEICRRNDQSAGQRINTIIDRYAFLIATQRAAALGLFGENELDELALALKPIVARRHGAGELRQLWVAGLKNEDLQAQLRMMSSLEVLILAEELEGLSAPARSAPG